MLRDEGRPQSPQRVPHPDGMLGRRDLFRLSGVAGLAGVGTALTQNRSRYSQLAGQLHGGLSLPGSSGYRPEALLYNPRFRGRYRPQAIAHCRSTADVAACVRFATEGHADLRLRCGGHSYGGWSSGPGLVVDVSGMNGVRVDRAAGTATVGAGALLANVYTALGGAGVSIGAGSCPTVGVTGLTLGGGIGVLSRSYGLTCDQVRSLRVVTADGRTRTVDAHREPDLFWALRGGGGGLAAVTELTFAVRPAPRITTFYLRWSWPAAADVLEAWQRWIQQAPRELWSTCKLLAAPGKGARIVVSGTWTGAGSPQAQLRRLLAGIPRPVTNVVGAPGGYTATMLAEAGCRGETASACVTAARRPAARQAEAATSAILSRPLPARGVAAIVEKVGAGMDVAGMVEGGVSFDAVGGAVGDVAAGASAVPWRSALAVVQYTATWPYAHATSHASRYDAFVHAEQAALRPYLGRAGYANYPDPARSDYAQAYWGTNLPRLRGIKRRFDPTGVFSFPQSVPR